MELQVYLSFLRTPQLPLHGISAIYHPKLFAKRVDLECSLALELVRIVSFPEIAVKKVCLQHVLRRALPFEGQEEQSSLASQLS